MCENWLHVDLDMYTNDHLLKDDQVQMVCLNMNIFDIKRVYRYIDLIQQITFWLYKWQIHNATQLNLNKPIQVQLF